MRKICLIFLSTSAFDGKPLITAFEKAFSELELDAEIRTVHASPSGIISLQELNGFKRLVRDCSANRFVIFHSGMLELFLEEPDFLLLFSAYRTSFNSDRVRVLPHIWTPTGVPEDTGFLNWSAKPALRLGFMGTLHGTSRLQKLVLSSPRFIRNWLLSGAYLRNTHLNAAANGLGFTTRSLNTFVRSETLDALRLRQSKYKNVQLEIIERQAFTGSQQHMLEYREHLQANTYIICPRGIENYSYRMYEALNFGRVPVIIDTDMVLPKEIDWDNLCVRVPYASLDKIYDYILEDYYSKTEQDFIDRQHAAISTMLKLQTTDWVKVAVQEILARK